MCYNGDICAMKQAYIAKIENQNDALKQELIEAKDIIFDLIVALKNIMPRTMPSLEEIERAEKFLKEEPCQAHA